jgi:hypothetical protein
MSSARYKLRLAGAFAALATLVLAASCRGFFVNPTVSSIAVDPPSPSVGFGPNATSQQMTAIATFSDGSTSTLTAGTSCTGTTVCWSSSEPSVATITTGGLLTGVSAGTTTITAASGAITGTTTATAAETVTSMTITPATTAIPDDGETAAVFTIDGTTSSGTQDISALVTLTAATSSGTATNITCTAGTNTSGDAVQNCIAQAGTVTGTAVTYTVTVTYSGYTGTAAVTAQLTVNPL